MRNLSAALKEPAEIRKHKSKGFIILNVAEAYSVLAGIALDWEQF